ncbi:MAG: ATP-binding protein [Bacteroidia bacterium]|nr:ATP-binding protein [Bacteroidia bacterium]
MTKSTPTDTVAELKWEGFDAQKFEALINALVIHEVSKHARIFDAPGKDQGIDQYFEGTYGGKTGKWRFQDKLRTEDKYKDAFSALSQTIKEDILSNFRGEDYIVYATNLSLKPNEKDSLTQVALKSVKAEWAKLPEIFFWDAAHLKALLAVHPVIRQSFWGKEASMLHTYQVAFSRELDPYSEVFLPLTTSLFGREKQKEALRKFLNTPNKTTFLVSGHGGFGKTRLCLDFFQNVVDQSDVWHPYVLIKDNYSLGQFGELLSGIDKMVILIDDADREIHLDGILSLASSHKEKVKILLTARSATMDIINQSLTSNSVLSADINLGPLEGKQAFELSKYLLRPFLKVPENDEQKRQIQDIQHTFWAKTEGIPWVAMTLIRAIAKNQTFESLLKDASLGFADAFKRILKQELRFLQENLKISEESIYIAVQALALLSPFDDYSIQELSEPLGLNHRKLKKIVTLLEENGWVSKRDANLHEVWPIDSPKPIFSHRTAPEPSWRYRLRPDPYRDLLARDFLDEEGMLERICKGVLGARNFSGIFGNLLEIRNLLPDEEKVDVLRYLELLPQSILNEKIPAGAPERVKEVYSALPDDLRSLEIPFWKTWVEFAQMKDHPQWASTFQNPKKETNQITWYGSRSNFSTFITSIFSSVETTEEAWRLLPEYFRATGDLDFLKNVALLNNKRSYPLEEELRRARERDSLPRKITDLESTTRMLREIAEGMGDWIKPVVIVQLLTELLGSIEAQDVSNPSGPIGNWIFNPDDPMAQNARRFAFKILEKISVSHPELNPLIRSILFKAISDLSNQALNFHHEKWIRELNREQMEREDYKEAKLEEFKFLILLLRVTLREMEDFIGRVDTWIALEGNYRLRNLPENEGELLKEFLAEVELFSQPAEAIIFFLYTRSKSFQNVQDLLGKNLSRQIPVEEIVDGIALAESHFDKIPQKYSPGHWYRFDEVIITIIWKARLDLKSFYQLLREKLPHLFTKRADFILVEIISGNPNEKEFFKSEIEFHINQKSPESIQIAASSLSNWHLWYEKIFSFEQLNAWADEILEAFSDYSGNIEALHKMEEAIIHLNSLLFKYSTQKHATTLETFLSNASSRGTHEQLKTLKIREDNEKVKFEGFESLVDKYGPKVHFTDDIYHREHFIVPYLESKTAPEILQFFVRNISEIDEYFNPLFKHPNRNRLVQFSLKKWKNKKGEYQLFDLGLDWYLKQDFNSLHYLFGNAYCLMLTVLPAHYKWKTIKHKLKSNWEETKGNPEKEFALFLLYFFFWDIDEMHEEVAPFLSFIGIAAPTQESLPPGKYPSAPVTPAVMQLKNALEHFRDEPPFQPEEIRRIIDILYRTVYYNFSDYGLGEYEDKT